MSLQFLNFKPVFLIDMVSYLLLAYFNYLVFLGTIIQLNLTIQQWSSAYIIMESWEKQVISDMGFLIKYSNMLGKLFHTQSIHDMIRQSDLKKPRKLFRVRSGFLLNEILKMETIHTPQFLKFIFIIFRILLFSIFNQVLLHNRFTHTFLDCLILLLFSSG